MLTRPLLRAIVSVSLLLLILLPGGLVQAQDFPTVPADPPAPPGADPSSPRPDIVVFILDDIPPLDGRMWTKLPNIERLFVKQGVEFTDAHGETPTCCPGRAGFLTGLHTHHHGTFRTDGSLFQPGMTIATALQDSGYRTIQVGKYLNLFERVFPKLPPGWSDFHGFGGAYYDYRIWSNGRPRQFGHKARDYSTDVIRRTTLAALERVPRDRRIFAWITPYSMHKPWDIAPRHKRSRACNGLGRWKPPGYMERNVSDKPAYIRVRPRMAKKGLKLTGICRGLLSVDQMVGQVEEQLRRSGRLDNTVLILAGDNGMSYGSQRILHDKKVPYATQIPLFIRWPRVLGTEPRQIDERVMNIDLAPTLCEIVGCELGPYPTGQRKPDGLSFLRLLTGDQTTMGRPATLHSYQDDGHRVPTYWSSRSTSSSPLANRGCKAQGSGGCRWLYTVYETGERELYDISNGPCYAWRPGDQGDPCMLKNRAGKKRFASVERAMARQLNRLH
jgi:arylsulfatase A-like enzyme